MTPTGGLKDLIQREKVDLAAALPGPMALRRERETFPDSLLSLPDTEAVRAVLEDFNARVIADRRRPVAGQGSPAVVGRVDVEAMLARWAESKAQVTARLPPETAADQAEAPQPPPRRRRWWRCS